MSTRDRIIDTTRRLIQTRAYHGFSFQDIADNVGIKKASLYHHFKSKDEVAIEVLRTSIAAIETEALTVANKPASEKLEKYLAMARTTQGAGERMCPGCSFAAVLDAVSPAVQGEVQRFIRFHLDLLEQILREGREAGEFHFERSAKAEAEYLFSSIQGAITIARLTGSAKVFDNVVAHVKDYFEAPQAEEA
jgi:TetR/AcrR family transcriptional repressor of nem operon